MHISLENVLFLVGKGEFSSAKKQIESLLEQGHAGGSDHLYSLAKCISFWAYRIKKSSFNRKQVFMQLISQWNLFQIFCQENGILLEENLSLFAKGVFASCQDFFLEKRNDIPREFWNEMVKILISRGELTLAKENLQEQLKITPKDVSVLQLLSVVCYKLGNVSLAKLYLSYAFLFDPLKVDIAKMIIPEVIRIKLSLMQNGFRGEELLLWIPVYASTRGVFLSKKLSKSENRFVLHTIKKMEEVCTQENLSKIQPILLYYYMFALHHFYLNRDDACVRKILQRIHYSNERIYQEVVNITLKKKTTSTLASAG